MQRLKGLVHLISVARLISNGLAFIIITNITDCCTGSEFNATVCILFQWVNYYVCIGLRSTSFYHQAGSKYNNSVLYRIYTITLLILLRGLFDSEISSTSRLIQFTDNTAIFPGKTWIVQQTLIVQKVLLVAAAWYQRHTITNLSLQYGRLCHCSFILSWDVRCDRVIILVTTNHSAVKFSIDWSEGVD